MHMADALLSPTVGGIMWTASCGAIAHCSNRVLKDQTENKTPLMGVFGAFIFAAQMLNFTIPATGSSGHLGGGLLLAVLLGPCAAFLTIASVVMVQAVMFADGGLLALGCNIINLGALPAFISYPLIYKPIAGNRGSRERITIASIVAAIFGVQLGAFGVVLETVASGISELPMLSFLSLMLPIHLVIGIVEGAVTALILSFIYKARPELLAAHNISNRRPFRAFAAGIFMAALLMGVFLSRYASELPDGLEWSIRQLTGSDLTDRVNGPIHTALSRIQKHTAILPDYSFRTPDARPENILTEQHIDTSTQNASIQGSGVAGLTGSLLIVVFSLLIAIILRLRSTAAARESHNHEHSHPHRHHHEHLHRHSDCDLPHSHPHDHEHVHAHPHRHNHRSPHSGTQSPVHAHAEDPISHNHDHSEHENELHKHSH